MRIIIECPENILHLEAGYIYADCLFDSSTLLQSGGGPYIPPVPCKGMVIAVVTPVSAITRLAVMFPMADGVNVRYISQLWPGEIVPMQEYPSNVKLLLLVPLKSLLLFFSGLFVAGFCSGLRACGRTFNRGVFPPDEPDGHSLQMPAL